MKLHLVSLITCLVDTFSQSRTKKVNQIRISAHCTYSLCYLFNYFKKKRKWIEFTIA